MANLSPYLAIKQLTLDPANFVTVTAIVACDAVEIYNSGNVDTKVRSDPADATTEDTIPAGNQETYTSPKGEFTPGVPRYPLGSSIVALKPISGTGPAILKFLA